DVDNGEPKTADDAQKQQVEDGLNKEKDEQERFTDDSITKDVNAAGQQVNTASSDVNIGSLKLSVVGPSIRVDLPNGKKAIGTKWVFRNKKDERGIVIRNKAWLVAQGHRQEEGIDYEEAFAPVARIEAIRLFLAYASFMGFLVYQIDVKSSFLYATIEEEVYVMLPPGFKDPDHPNKVYKVVKALYGLHQVPRAWYETLANYLLSNWFKRGKIDQTLFIKKQKGDVFLVQVYVDDIIFGLTNKELYTGFEKLIKDKFQLSSMGELTFFLGFAKIQLLSASTPVDLEKDLVMDGDADDVDVHFYRSMIGSLMYLTASRLDFMFAGVSFKLVTYTDSDYAGATQDRKSTTGGCQFLGNRLISWQCKKQTVVATSTTEAEYVAAASCCEQIFLQKVLMQEDFNTWSQVLEWMGNKMERATTTATSYEAEQDMIGDVNAQTSLRLHLNIPLIHLSKSSPLKVGNSMKLIGIDGNFYSETVSIRRDLQLDDASLFPLHSGSSSILNYYCKCLCENLLHGMIQYSSASLIHTINAPEAQEG
ncbi:putative ribonuclease H-like domain-containing protein, partial [Tanacetum coccineum]